MFLYIRKQGTSYQLAYKQDLKMKMIDKIQLLFIGNKLLYNQRYSLNEHAYMYVYTNIYVNI